MNKSRLLSLVLVWVVMSVVGASATLSPGLLFQFPVLAFVLGLPLLGGLATSGAGPVWVALRDSLSGDARDLPESRRRTGASTLRSLGGMCVAAGILGFVGTLIGTLTLVTVSAGSADPRELLSAVPGMLLAPVYGLALKAFLFDVLAEALDGAEPELWRSLEDA